MSFDSIPLGDLLGDKGYIRGPFGSALKRSELKEDGIPVYEQQHAIRGDREFRYYIDGEKYNKLKRFTVKSNDLIISCSGTVGRISIINEDDPKGIISQALLILRPNTEKISSQFLYYFFTSKNGFNELINASQGAVQLNIAPRAVVEKILIPTPSPETQKKIVDILKSIDNRIALNHQINQNLEAMAQAIFKSWFVDFDPVKAKITAIEAGEDPESVNRAGMRAISGRSDEGLDKMQAEQPEEYAQLKGTAELFPAAMWDSELGEVPEGWNPKKVSDFVELAYGKALKKTSRIEGEIPVYGSGGVNGTHNISLVEGPGIIIGRKGTVGSLYWEDKSFYPIDTVFYVKPMGKISLEFAYYLLQTLGLESMNTDAVVPGLNRNNVYRLDVLGFDDNLIAHFTDTVKLIRKMITITLSEISLLDNLRDTLLPKLLSGDVVIDFNGVMEADV